MSLTRTKWILAISMVVLTLIIPKNVWGGGNGFRLWTPYTDTQKRRDPNGLYVELEAVYKTISAAPNATIGYSNPDGHYRVMEANTVVDPRNPVDGEGNTQYLAVGTIVNRDASKVFTETSGALGERLVWNGNNAIRQNNTLNTNFIDPNFVAGTRVTVGYVRQHHGWRFIFEGLPSQQQTVTVNGASMVLFDSETVTSYTLATSNSAYNMALRPSDTDPTKYVWKNVETGSHVIDTTGTSSDTGLVFKPMENVGYLWAWFPSEWSDWEQGKLAAAPITYTYASITSKADHWSTELMYTYRMHPLRCGSFEISAGFRYWELKDTLSFYGSGNTLITDGDKNENITNQPNDDQNVTGSGSSNTSNTSNSNTSYYNQSQLGIRNDSGGLTVLTDTTINSTGFNQIFGPQVGLRFHRKTSRWTGIAECKFFAGINNQERRTSGILGSYLVDTGNVYGLRTGTGTGTGTSTTGTSTTGSDTILDNPYHQHGIYPFIPIGYTHNANSFGHKKFYRTFSPGVELQLNANWQLTKAVGLQVGFTSMYVHDVIRGAQVCDYTIHDDGSYFGVRSGNSVCSDVFVYGVTFGLVANRY